MQPEDPLADEVAGMVDALLEGRLGPADVQRLEELVCTNADARRAYLRYMHLNCSIPPHLGVPTEPALADEDTAPATQPADMNETLMMPALQTASDGEDDREPAILPPPVVWQRKEATRPIRRYAAAAAVLIVATLAIAIWLNHGSQTTVSKGGTPPPRPATTEPSPVAPGPAPAAPQPVAHLTALADAVIDGPAVRPGAALLPGDALHLLRGAAEVSYANGAVLVVEGPASLTVVDGSTARLDRGKVAARVPHQSPGFRVTSAKLTVTDLGTEFGVDVSPERVALAHVFEGRITVALPGKSSDPISAVKVLGRDQTVQCPITGGTIQSMPKLPETFTRDISQYALPLPLHSTGAGATEGSPDPNWQFVGDSNDPKLVSRPATVAAAYVTSVPGKKSYLPNSSSSRWISTQAKLSRVAAGTYTFRTHIDLSGLDLARVNVLAYVAADDEIKQARVNGHPVRVSQLGDPGIQYARLHKLAISEGLIAGVNTVEFDVWNSRDQMALRVQWDATVRAPVVR